VFLVIIRSKSRKENYQSKFVVTNRAL
jgi:hypothetical protein